MKRYALASAFSLLAIHACAAPSPALTGSIGSTRLHAASFRYTGNVLHLSGGATLDSPEYGLQADSIVATLIPGKTGPQAIKEAIALGDPATHSPVVGRFRQLESGDATPPVYRTYIIQAAKAVYTPTPEGPGQGQIVFSGETHIQTLDPTQLADPGETTADGVVIELGVGPDFPQISGTDLSMTFTPLPSPPSPRQQP